MTDPRSQVGPMARYAADLAIALRVLAGPDGIDSGVVPVPLPKRVPKLGGLRVAWYADDGMAKPMPAITATVKAAAKADRGLPADDGLLGPQTHESRPHGPPLGCISLLGSDVHVPLRPRAQPGRPRHRPALQGQAGGRSPVQLHDALQPFRKPVR